MIKAARKIIDYVFGKGLGGETVRYIIVGGLTTLVNYGLFELLWGVIGIDDTISNVTSIFSSIIFAYVANKLVVFRWHCNSKVELVLEFIKFVFSRLFTMAIEVGAVYLFATILGFNTRLVKIASMVVVIILNYVISKVIVFRRGTKESPEDEA